MQRRLLIKNLLCLSVTAGSLLAGIPVYGATLCARLSASSLLQRLRPFSDAQLGKAGQQPVGNGLEQFSALCEESFDHDYRALVVQDFSAGKVVRVDQWLLSETEAITHRAVYLSGVPQGGGSVP